jgi:hypothetical protein
MHRSKSNRPVRPARRAGPGYCRSVLDRVFVGILIARFGATQPMTSWCSTGDLAYLALAVLLALAWLRIWLERRRLRRDSWRGPG